MEETDTSTEREYPPLSDEVTQCLPEISISIPAQMTEQEMIDLLEAGEDPIDVSIKKYEMFRKWCEYQFVHDWTKIRFERLIGAITCALCHTNEDCSDCVLSKIGYMCCPDKCVISPWNHVQIECNRIDDTEESHEDLLDAIDNMINVLNEAKENETV